MSGKGTGDLKQSKPESLEDLDGWSYLNFCDVLVSVKYFEMLSLVGKSAGLEMWGLEGKERPPLMGGSLGVLLPLIPKPYHKS